METAATTARGNAHLRAIAGALLLSFCALSAVATLACFALVHVSREMGGNRDFVVYWATGRQLVQHLNPYDGAALRVIEHQAGLPHQYSVGYMRNPPWALPLTYPLGLLSLRAAAVLGSLALIAAFVLSVRILLSLYGCRDGAVQAIAYLFAPALICLIWGQTSLLVSLGLVLFMRFHTTHPILAGASLWLCMLKPHLLLPFGLVLLVWVVSTRSYRIVAGAAAAFVVAVGITFLADPQAWGHYSKMLAHSGVETDPIPAFSVLLRTSLAPRIMVLQFAPAAIACTWALVYFWSRRRNWDWARDGSLLLLVSLVAAPYAFLNDHSVVLPAIVSAAGRAASRPLLAVLGLASALLEVAFFLHWWSPAPFYWATMIAAPFWLVWYGFATRHARG